MQPFNPRQLCGADLKHALLEARARTWQLVDDLTDTQWQPALQSGVNLVAWELAHLAWFAEFWILRGPHRRDADGFATAAHAPRFGGPDAYFDSARLEHTRRWSTPLPSRSELKRRLQDQLDACLDTIPQTPSATPADIANADQALYFHRLALFHEDMHAEAFCWMRAALGYAAPAGQTWPFSPAGQTAGGAAARQIAHAGGAFEMGFAANTPGFAFDNECASQQLRLDPFSIDNAPVSAGEFARFVDAGGYLQTGFWPGEAGRWRAACGLTHPAQWRRSTSGEWLMHWFDHAMPLPVDAPVIHVNAYEAQAYCLWTGRRLPSAAEWECAALNSSGSEPPGGAAFSWGHSVWEWTADAFTPYPGFTPGPYREYSQPWFGNHRELRGGAFATHARMQNARYRNFFLPQRSDIFAGFRTASL